MKFDKTTKEGRRFYWVWASIIQRCENPANKQYADYGGRGIKVCTEWLDFNGFLCDMWPRPAGAVIDRVDNDRGYSKENCRWVDRKQSNSNRRYCIYVSDDGERVTLKEYCRRHGLKYRPIVKRIQDRDWSVEDALSVPVGYRHAVEWRRRHAKD